MKTAEQYHHFKKPSWAPPSWIFGPVWSVLYLIIAVSFGYIFIKYFERQLPFMVALPFFLNLIFNVLYTPIQFKLKNFTLALIDILLVDATLVWALIQVFRYYPLVMYTNIPYLCWVTFATILQITITVLNRRR